MDRVERPCYRHGFETQHQRNRIQRNLVTDTGHLSKEFKNLKTDGTATLEATAKGILQGDTVPQFDVRLAVKNAMFRYPSLPAGVDQINIDAQVRNPGGNIDLTEISIHPFSFRLAENRLV